MDKNSAKLEIVDVSLIKDSKSTSTMRRKGIYKLIDITRLNPSDRPKKAKQPTKISHNLQVPMKNTSPKLRNLNISQMLFQSTKATDKLVQTFDQNLAASTSTTASEKLSTDDEEVP